jgi:membrane-associated phospholipid phosphatase
LHLRRTERNRLLVLAAGFAALFFPAFYWLGHRSLNYHIIGIPFDQLIPFNEWFIIPYLGWFVFMATGILYVYVYATDTDETYRLAATLIIGMILALLVYLVFPNKVLLRPEVMPRDNPLTALTLIVYQIDSVGNALPSLHTYNTVILMVALMRTPRFKRHRWLAAASMGFAILVVLSTFFVKQHSVLDALVSLSMAGVICPLVYTLMGRASTRVHATMGRASTRIYSTARTAKTKLPRRTTGASSPRWPRASNNEEAAHVPHPHL